jgi:hypothetical protein
MIASCFIAMPATQLTNKSHEHWSKQKARADEQKLHTGAAVRSMPILDQANVKLTAISGGLLVRLVSISVKAMDDDNLTASMKYYRDEIARWLGVDDNDPRVKYVVTWERYKGVGRRGVRVEFIRLKEYLQAQLEEIEAQLATLV